MFLLLPARGSSPRRGRYIELPQFSGVLARHIAAGYSAGDFKVLVRAACKRHPLYYLPIPCEFRSPAKYRHGRRVIVIREDAVQILTEEAYNASLAQKSAPEEVIE